MIELQRKLLGDQVRNQAFSDALRKVVKPGSTVIDLGSGTGFLSFLASKMGAKQCVLYEISPDMLRLSKQLAARNGIKSCRFVHAHSHEVSKPVQGDVVVSETLGNFALEEHLIENMEDAKRFLKPGGVLMPLTLTQYVVPVVSDRLQREIDIWGDVGFGVDLRAAREVALHNMYVKTVTPKDLWPGKDAAQVWDRLDFHTHEGSQRKGEGEWNAEKDTTVYGFCLYWECELSPGIVLSTSPWEPATHWEQIYLPLLSSLRVTQGETLRVTLTSDTRHTVGVRVTWQTGSQLMDTKKGCI